MEKTIRKKVQVYTVIAILAALTLGALCLNLGVVPFVPTVSALQRFSSYDELKSFLINRTQGSNFYRYLGPLDATFFGVQKDGFSAVPSPAAEGNGYSTTNIQVSGVDEADIVKTDGVHIYMVANNTVFILKAYPPEEAELLSKIGFEEAYLAGVFISQDGNRLAVLGSSYSAYKEPVGIPDKVPTFVYRPSIDGVRTFINVYDVSNKSNPMLKRDFMVSGSYFSSRMIGEYIYAVMSEPAYVLNETVVLPEFYEDGVTTNLTASQVYYSNSSDNYFMFTTVVAMNIMRDEQEPTNMSIMMGGASTMYVSTSNMYVTFQELEGQTSIYRIRVEKSTLSCDAQGKVPGSVLNQFSMDEHEGYFRIATTTWTGEVLQNNIYALNTSLGIAGRLEKLAPGERLHSARFMGEKCYLVTFKNIDPLFVIDLSQPTEPKVLGELKIPGYSDYLHMYDETHLIGVGKETVEATEADFAWYQGVKLSLFDVTDVNNPKQLAKYVIGDRGTDSPILWNHKAFLFDKSKNLLVIPANVAEITGTPDKGTAPSPTTPPINVTTGIGETNETSVPPRPDIYGQFMWQGACVFKITLTDGFVLKGNVTHVERSEDLQDSSFWINRALYINNVLYTVSGRMVKLNDLETLALIKQIDLSH
jgi:uncharacterized secreted protein with C-terminal beta-propeller domain